jgi:hypothetical protein
MLKRILVTTALIVALASAAVLYVNRILIPVQVKDMVLRSLKEQLKRELTFDRLYYHPLKGFVLTDLDIRSKDKNDESFVRLDEISAQVLFLPLIHKKIVIPNLQVTNPSVRIIHFSENLWNFSDLLPAPSKTAKQETPAFQIIVSGFSLTNGRIQISDLSGEKPFEETIEPVNLKGSLALDSSIALSGTIGLPATKGTLGVEARYLIKEESFKGTLEIAGLSAGRYLRFAPVLPLTIRQLDLTSARITAFWAKGKLELEGSAAIAALDADPAPKTSIKTALDMKDVFLTMTSDGAISLQGRFKTAETLLSASPDISLSASLSADISSLQLDKNGLKTEGSLEAEITSLNLPAQQSVSGKLKVNSATLTMKEADISASGGVEITNLLLTLGKTQNLKADQAIADIQFKSGSAGLAATGNIEIKNLLASIDALTIQTSVSANETRLETVNGKPVLTSRIDCRNTRMTMPQDMTFEGEPRVLIRLAFDPGNPQPLAYEGSVSLDNARMSKVPQVDQVSAISTRATFTTDKLTINSLSLNTLDTDISLTGEISRFADPLLKIQATVPRFDLAMATRLIPELIKEHQLALKGTLQAQASINGSLAKIMDAEIDAQAILADVWISSDKLAQKLENLSGTLTYLSGALTIKELTTTFQNRPFTINGTIKNLITNPDISASLKTGDIVLGIDARKTADTVHINKMSASALDSTLTLNGLISLPAGQNPSMDIHTEINLSLQDLPGLLPTEQAEQLKNLQASGTLLIKGDIKGPVAEWMKYSSTLSIESSLVKIMGYKLQNLSLQAKQKDGLIEPLSLEGNLYNGALMLDASLRLDQADMPFTTVIKLDRTDLALLKKDTPLSQKQISGFLSVDGKLKGETLKWQKMNGQARVTVTEGYLWEFEILSRVLNILSTTFQGGDIIITDASATLDFADEKITTNDLTLKSRSVSILGEGWLDWNQNIDMNITPRLEPLTEAGAAINPTDGLINIRVSGTLSKPKIEHDLGAPALIKKTLQNTVGGLLKIFE